jgi:hypothetical protein
MSGLSEELKQYQNEEAKSKRFEGAVFIVLALVGIGECLESLKYRSLPLAKMGPGFFPTLVGMLLFVASAAELMKQHVVFGKKTVVLSHKDGNLIRFKRVRKKFVLTALVIGYLLSYSTVGFLLCTTVLVSGFMVAAGEKRIIQAVLVGSAIALVAELVFGIGLKLYLPAGMFGINEFL